MMLLFVGVNMRALFYANDATMSAVVQRRVAHKEYSSEQSLRCSIANTDGHRLSGTAIDSRIGLTMVMMSSTM
jgi:hypothetical protein